MKTKTINTVHLFAGCGGEATGAKLALSRLGLKHKGIAINHWDVAVATMRANHDDIHTFLMKVEDAIPEELMHGERVHLLWASPSCTHHSRAKGGRPRSNQLRAQPYLINPWLLETVVEKLVVENVPEFVDWGPLDDETGKPIERKKGACFRAWVDSIKACNYKVEWRILNCADYGDATSRRRFFLQAVRRGCGKIRWPEATHAENPETDLWGHTPKKWRGAKEFLDFNDLGRSIFEPGRNLAMNTLRRVDAGMRKFNGMSFLMDMLGTGKGDESRVHSLADPLPVQHASGNRCAVVRPFVVKLNHNADAEDIEKPLTTVLSGGQHHALCTPFIVRSNKGCYAESVDAPLSSQQASTVHHALCQPLIIDHFKNGEAHSVDEPLGSQTTHDRYSVATPFIVEHRNNGTAKPLDGPIGAQTTKDKFSICTPLILGQNGGAQALPVAKPCPTIATKGAIRLATPVIVDMSHPGGNDSGHIGSADDPIRTITTFDNVQLALPMLEDGRLIDIRLRMLKPSELAAAHSFPADYKLAGNRTEQIKQIGNSVPVMTAAAICEAALGAA
jgi:DNA (cytosine-5)-methyltransferase 1